jgi:hypothetical protein
MTKAGVLKQWMNTSQSPIGINTIIGRKQIIELKKMKNSGLKGSGEVIDQI